MNQIYNFIKPCLIILISTVASCMPPAFVQNQSVPEQEYYEGTEMIAGEDSLFQAWMSYEFRDGDFHVFYVHLVNYSVLSAQFDPSACYLEYESRISELADDPNLRVYALNPEFEIQSIAEEKEDAENDNALDLGLNIVSAVIDIGTNVFNGNTADDMEIFEDLFYWGDNISSNIEEGKMQSEFFEESETFWKNEVLRKTIIQSGEETGGLVYFPIQKRSRDFYAIVPFGGTDNVFGFELSTGK